LAALAAVPANTSLIQAGSSEPTTPGAAAATVAAAAATVAATGIPAPLQLCNPVAWANNGNIYLRE
jgi:hypothetical protein